MVTTAEFLPYARQGRALLDQHYGDPDWRTRIDRDQLWMGSFTQCVLGQLFGHFDDGVATLFGLGAKWNGPLVQAAGFVVSDAIDDREWLNTVEVDAAFTAAWRQVLDE